MSEKSEARSLISSMLNPYGDREIFLQNYFKEKGTTIVKLRHRLFNYFPLCYDLSDNYQMAIASEFLTENIYDFSKLKFIPKHIIDCGGYKGYFTWSALKKFKKSNFICIEPHPGNYNSIKEVVLENTLSNIKIINKALSTSREPLKLCVNGTMADIYSNIGKIIEIETIDLNKIIENRCDLLLKVDIEGAELEFFPDIIYALPRRCAVYLESS